MGNKWCFHNKNVFATDRVVWVTTGLGKNLKMVNLEVFKFVNFRAHKKLRYQKFI